MHLRRIPYPYRAMLAICSDLDETPDQQVYFETIRYLNTTETTNMGRGLGLETGNTIYFDMPPEQFAYWNTDDRGRAIIRTLIQSGHIDCLHSYGDLATTRAHAARALEELSRHNCQLEVWIDHGTAPSNFGKDIMRGQGDVVGSEVYHADLTTDYGIKYVWIGRVTSVIGQDVNRSLCGIWNHRYPIISAQTLLKEMAKGVLVHGKSSKYAMHGPNQVLREIQLRSGHKVYEFMRSSPHWGGVSFNDRAEGLTEILSKGTLARLVEREGVSIIYIHLGKFYGPEPFSPATQNALELLARYSQDKILVTTTSRLLRYRQAIQAISLSLTHKGEHIGVDVSTEDSEKDLEGLSIYTPLPNKTHITINGNEVKNIQHNAPDHTGQQSVSLPWRPLEFPKGLH